MEKGCESYAASSSVAPQDVNSAGASEARVAAAAAAANLVVSVLLEVTHCIMPVLGSRGIPQDKVRITKNFILLLVISFPM